MKLLGNHKSWREYYDMSTGSFHKFDSSQNAVGFYQIVDGIFTAMFVENWSVYLQYDNKKYDINDDYHIILDDVGKKRSKNYYDLISDGIKKYQRIFKIYDGDNLMLQFNYEAEESYSFLPEFGTCADEDFDWGLFLLNIINDKERKAYYIKAVMEKIKQDENLV